MAGEKLKDERPWGTWEIIALDPAYKIKRIVVRPGQRLSYQKHAQRREIWTAAAGKGLITLDGKQLELSPGQTIEVPIGCAHRVANPGKTDFVFIEVQLGSYFGEDDIVRLEDDYGRSG
ncbi:MAG: phosphomannose isomerase type II C-terminal cupin domain [Elusimicrobia bacterium]|nr:phosphomannose isomerase type II C-terminal cupin domain [Elusimicrobiota bacterium]